MLRLVKTLFTVVFLMVCIAIIAWITISYVNVLAHNLHTGYEYPSWNFFTIFLK